LLALKKSDKIDKWLKQIMHNRMKNWKKQTGKRDHLPDNNNDSSYGCFWPNRFRTLLADILAPFLKKTIQN
jgi:hypothetical protein